LHDANFLLDIDLCTGVPHGYEPTREAAMAALEGGKSSRDRASPSRDQRGPIRHCRVRPPVSGASMRFH